jgi:hypothetical protein
MKNTILTVAALVFAAALYIVSIGPAWALAKHGHFSRRAFQTIYSPLAGLENHCPGDLLWRYENRWAPVMDIHL